MERNLANYIFVPETMSGNIEVGGQSICGGQSNWQSFAHHGNTASVPGRPDQRPGSRGGFIPVGVSELCQASRSVTELSS